MSNESLQHTVGWDLFKKKRAMALSVDSHLKASEGEKRANRGQVGALPRGPLRSHGGEADDWINGQTVGAPFLSPLTSPTYEPPKYQQSIWSYMNISRRNIRSNNTLFQKNAYSCLLLCIRHLQCRNLERVGMQAAKKNPAPPQVSFISNAASPPPPSHRRVNRMQVQPVQKLESTLKS